MGKIYKGGRVAAASFRDEGQFVPKTGRFRH